MYAVDSFGTGWAIDTKGTVVWSKPYAPSSGFFSQATSTARVGDVVVFIVSGVIKAVNAKTGSVIWSEPPGASSGPYVGGAVVDGNMRLYVNAQTGVHAFDLSGKSLWTYAISDTGAWGELAIGPDGTLYAPRTNGYVWALR
jgi:outer membrane protein assembly factor BamB